MTYTKREAGLPSEVQVNLAFTILKVFRDSELLSLLQSISFELTLTAKRYDKRRARNTGFTEQGMFCLTYRSKRLSDCQGRGTVAANVKQGRHK